MEQQKEDELTSYLVARGADFALLFEAQWRTAVLLILEAIKQRLWAIEQAVLTPPEGKE